jgi:hypothetical protein
MNCLVAHSGINCFGNIFQLMDVFDCFGTIFAHTEPRAYFSICYGFPINEIPAKTTAPCKTGICNSIGCVCIRVFLNNGIKNGFYIKQYITTPKRNLFRALFGVFPFVKSLKIYYYGNN